MKTLIKDDEVKEAIEEMKEIQQLLNKHQILSLMLVATKSDGSVTSFTTGNVFELVGLNEMLRLTFGKRIKQIEEAKELSNSLSDLIKSTAGDKDFIQYFNNDEDDDDDDD